MPLIEPGRKAPAFALKDQSGKTHRLSQYTGRPVILYFYPKDDTPGCTKEACAFQAGRPKFKPSKAAVLGVSILDEASKARFAKKYGLGFPLLSDPDHEAAEKYGVWQEKSQYGRTYMGIVRRSLVGVGRADLMSAQMCSAARGSGQAPTSTAKTNTVRSSCQPSTPSGPGPSAAARSR